MSAAYDRWVADARAVRIEDEIERRGIRLYGRNDRCGPCPVCGGSDRFSINIRKQVFRCRPYSGGDVIALVQHLDGCGFLTAVDTLAGERSAPRISTTPPARSESLVLYERQQHQKAAWLWSRGQPIRGTVAEKYARLRGIVCPLPATLRYWSPLKPEHRSAMIAAYTIADEPEPGALAEPRHVESVHLTFLRPDGSGKADVKPNKITVGSPAGRPIVVAPMNDLMGLAICEGIEDALSVHLATGLGAWAAGSAPFLQKLVGAVADVAPDCVTIYAHDDGGRNDAGELAEKLAARGFEVLIEGLDR